MVGLATLDPPYKFPTFRNRNKLQRMNPHERTAETRNIQCIIITAEDAENAEEEGKLLAAFVERRPSGMPGSEKRFLLCVLRVLCGELFLCSDFWPVHPVFRPSTAIFYAAFPAGLGCPVVGQDTSAPAMPGGRTICGTSIVRTWTSCCGKGISMPASRNARSMPMCSSWIIAPRLSRLGRKHRSTKLSELSPNDSKRNAGRRVAEHDGVVLGDLQEDLGRLSRVRAVGHADGIDDAVDRIGQRPVQHLAGDELLVGNDQFLAVAVGDGRGSHANPRDDAGDAVDGDDVAHADGPLEEDNQTGDEIGENLLQSEAQSQAHRGHEPLHLRPADAQRRRSKTTMPTTVIR